MKNKLLLLFSLLLIKASFAQDTTGAKQSNKIKFIPLPVIGANPAAGFMFGIAPGAYWMMGDPSNTSLSSALGAIVYTTNKQLLFTAKATTFFKADKWNMMTDIRYFLTSQPTYGLGTGPQSAKPVGTGFADYTDNPYEPISTAQMMAFNFVRVHNTLLKRIKDSRFFVGAGYHLDYHYSINDKLLDLNAATPVVTSHYAYSKTNDFSTSEYLLSGVSANFLLDSRDNGVNPYKGRYFFANIRMNPTFLGSEKGSSMLWVQRILTFI
jgi:hypothetical protein